MNSSILLHLVIANALLAVAPALPELVKAPPAIINETISMKKGLYLRTGGVGALKHGDIIAMPMNQSAKDYLGQQLGYPDDTMLLKRVVALPGETICRQDGTVVVPGRAVQAARRDSKGVLLPFWVGCHTLLPTEVFLLGDHPSSFDSRYFGPVLTRDLSGTYQEIISW